MKIRIRRGLDLPIPGAPVQAVGSGRPVRSVALLGDDFPKVRLDLAVGVGDHVRIGQTLARDRREQRVRFASPVSGRVAALHRGERRSIVALEIEVSGAESLEFPRANRGELASLGRERIAERLLEAGDWVALRTRPFGRIAPPDGAPAAIFVRAMDTNPLAADAAVVLRERGADLEAGLVALSQLTPGRVYLCSAPGALPHGLDVPRLARVEVRGPHPAGLVGTHIHHLLPSGARRSVWYASYQDVLAMGHLFREGRPDASRVIALAGPALESPRLVRSVLGASSEDLLRGELAVESCRVLSGSPLSGRRATRPVAFLGRYHEQLCAVPEPAPAAGPAWWMSGWQRARHSFRWRGTPLARGDQQGEHRSFYPLDLLDRAFPLRLPLAPLLRALVAEDHRAAASFGALELEEEDLALAAYLCPAGLEYGPLLRRALDRLEETLP